MANLQYIRPSRSVLVIGGAPAIYDRVGLQFPALLVSSRDLNSLHLHDIYHYGHLATDAMATALRIDQLRDTFPQIHNLPIPR